jgi:hypothetical protein
MKREIEDLLFKMQTGENCVGETADKLFDLMNVKGNVPKMRNPPPPPPKAEHLTANVKLDQEPTTWELTPKLKYYVYGADHYRKRVLMQCWKDNNGRENWRPVPTEFDEL